MKVLIIIIVAITFYFNALASPRKAIIKANIVMGERFVTANTSSTDIEQVLKRILTEKNYEVVERINRGEELLYFDMFVFQYPAEYPTVTLTVRTKDGIHYIDKEFVKLFGSRASANIKLAENVARRIPDEIDTYILYEPSIFDILSNSRVSSTGTLSSAVMNSYQANYSSVVKWPESAPLFLSYLMVSRHTYPFVLIFKA